MDFTKHEQTVIQELEKRAGDVLYIKDIAPYFISTSCLRISTYTQTAYIQVGDNMQNALSEYFQLVVFIKKLEQNAVCFSIPYTPLEDNLVQIGNSDFEEFQQHTIADGDLLIQLFHYASKKYVIAPNASDQFNNPIPTIQRQSKINLIIPSIILLLLFVFIGAIGYQSYLDNNRLKLKQESIGADLKKQTLNIERLSDRLQDQRKQQLEIHEDIKKDIDLINTSLKDQNTSIQNVSYWNRKQFLEIEKLRDLISRDSIP